MVRKLEWGRGKDFVTDPGQGGGRYGQPSSWLGQRKGHELNLVER